MEKKPRGGQIGNKNAKRAKHTRLVVSYSGPLLDAVYEALERDYGEIEPTEDRLREFILQMTRMGLEQ